MASEQLGMTETETHLLTSIRWNPMPEYGGRGSVETGIRDKIDGQVLPDSFHLIQHGWNRWQDAHGFIVKALAKRWSVYRIDKAMQFLKDRTRNMK